MKRGKQRSKITEYAWSSPYHGKSESVRQHAKYSEYLHLTQNRSEDDTEGGYFYMKEDIQNVCMTQETAPNFTARSTMPQCFLGDKSRSHDLSSKVQVGFLTVARKPGLVMVTISRLKKMFKPIQCENKICKAAPSTPCCW